MQDSLEDYVRISRNTKGEDSIKIKKETLVTAQVKKECEAKALQIVHFAIEGKLRPETLFKCLPHIDQSHYQDIVEERSISKLCGYPLCARRIPEMPKKQFFISTKNNKVYDITERKNYCTNYCYRASVHVKNQIDSSPLWLRKADEIPSFTLLNKTERGIPGDIVDQGFVKPVLEPIFTSISSFAEMSLDEAEENELKLVEEAEKEKSHKNYPKKPKKYQKSMKTINETNEEEQVELEEIRPSVKEAPAKQPPKSKTSKLELEALIKKCFKEWLTIESLIFLHGEDIVREKLDNAKLSDYFDTLRVAELRVEQQKKYVDICRKLHLRELIEEKFQSEVMGHQKFKPLPDYSELRKENKSLDLKVKSFYSGVLQVEEDSVKKEKPKEPDEEEGPPAVLPLVDLSAQNALRKKIFLNALNKSMQTLLQMLKMNPNAVLPDVNLLVKTFSLRADNIVFKPTVWNYIAIVLLKVLSVKDVSIQRLFEDERTKTQLKLSNKESFLKEILDIVSDIDLFVKDYIVSE